MICSYCGEEITGAHQYDRDTGMCKDYYKEKDMDRFKECDTPQSLTVGKLHSLYTSDHEPSLATPSEHTMISVLHRLLQESEDEEVKEHLVQTFAVVLGKSRLELELLLSQSSADMEDK